MSEPAKNSDHFDSNYPAGPRRSASQFALVLADRRGAGEVSVNLEAFFEFSFDLAEDLLDLVEQYRHFAPHSTANALPSEYDRDGSF